MIPVNYVVPALVFIAVIAVGAGILLLRSLREQSVRSRLGFSSESGEGQAALPRNWVLDMTGALGRMMGVGRTSQGLRSKLTQAGYHGEMAAAVFLGAKVILLVAGLGVFGTLTFPLDWPLPSRIIVVLAAAGFCAFVPNLVVLMRRSKRQAEIRRHLPDAIDLLEICVSGGMGLEMAWNVVTDEISQVSMLLGDEMAFTNLEIHLGATRGIAMKHMSERTGCQEVASLTAALTQSEQFGTSIGETLRVFAATMREGRSVQAAEAAEKMAVKLLFPLIFLIFPAMFVVVVGPAAIQWIELIGGGAGRR
jgi:tight adherence protein C